MSALPASRLLAAALALTSACREAPPPPPSQASPAAPAAPAPPGAPAQEVGWGVVEGQVALSGSPPPPALLPTTATVASVCGEQVPDGSLALGEGGALAQVVVAVQAGASLPGASRASPPTTLDQRRCAYVPAVAAARSGTSLQVRNSDPLVHNVRALEASRPVFNVAMPLEGMTLHKPLPPAPATVHVRCDIHPWMRAWVRTFDHPYFTTTDEAGRFRLELPEGTHTLLLWHPRLPEARLAQVKVAAGQVASVRHTWESGQLR